LNRKYIKEIKVQADFDEVIKIIYPLLNKVLKTNKTKLYWEIVLFNWLKGFLVYYNQNKEKKESINKINFLFKIKDTKYFFDNLDSSNEIFYKQFNYFINNLNKKSYKFIYYDLKFTVISSVIFFCKEILWIFFFNDF
jgi:hypothetical protein